jgi:hypothetical protein
MNNVKWKTNLPGTPGWYLTRQDGKLRVRAYGKGAWWIDLGRGDGKDGWACCVDPVLHYEWLDRVAPIDDPKPSIPQAIRRLSVLKQRFIMEQAADVYASAMKDGSIEIV